MKILSAELQKPDFGGFFIAFLVSATNILIAFMIGYGSVIPVGLATFVASLTTSCGANYKENGFRGLSFSIGSGLLIYILSTILMALLTQS